MRKHSKGKNLMLVLLLSILALILPMFSATCDEDPQRTGCILSFLNAGGPRIYSMNPTQAYQGETLDITIKGENFTGGEPIDLSEKVIVNNFIVNSDTQITANITVPEDAVIGTARIAVQNEKGIGNFLDFAILQFDAE